MQVRFWGTRGSIPKPGPDTIRYGGNTPCIEVRSASGTLVIIDGGSGLHALGQKLMREAQGSIRGHILISHTHWDHIQGIPFFAPFFIPGNRWDIYAPRGLVQSLQATLAGQMQYTYFPITLEDLGANIHYHDLVEGAFQIDDVEIRTRYLNHPALTFGYRLECDQAALVYACDHEPFTASLAGGEGEIDGADGEHAAFLANADLVIHDAQFTAAEYQDKLGWGHSTIEYAIAMCRHAGAKHLAWMHHDPLRTDLALDQLAEEARAGTRALGSLLQVQAAAEGDVIDLQGESSRDINSPDLTSALQSPVSALVSRSILLATRDKKIIETVSRAVEPDAVNLLVAEDARAVLDRVSHDRPSLVILDRNLPIMDGVSTCRAIRALPMPEAQTVPIVIVASQVESEAGAAAGVTDWLVGPFSVAYARTRIRAWLLRAASRWQIAPLPNDEESRLESLHRLGVLDTLPEERFDRLTRLAAALFDVQTALISLVDRDRQWLKSSHGPWDKEITRDQSFCAHAILQPEATIVADTLFDDRFADNPTVTGPRRIRFYAGCPLTLPDGSVAGTLCILDTRPRELKPGFHRLLRDLATLVERELADMAVPPSLQHAMTPSVAPPEGYLDV